MTLRTLQIYWTVSYSCHCNQLKPLLFLYPLIFSSRITISRTVTPVTPLIRVQRPFHTQFSWQALLISRWSVGKHKTSSFQHQAHILINNLSFRPVNAIEAREGGEIVVSFDDNLQSVQMKSTQVGSGPEKDGFTFDRVFPMGTKQHEVFDYGVKESVSLPSALMLD